MTCVVAIASKGRVIMGGDSAMQDEEEPTRFIAADTKVWRINRNMIAGFSGSWRVGLIAQSLKRTESAFEFRDALRAAMKSEDCDEMSWQVIIGVGGTIYEVNSDWAVIRYASLKRIGAYAASGTGANIALGACHALLSQSNRPDDSVIVKSALEAAAMHRGDVMPPFKILTTEPQSQSQGQRVTPTQVARASRRKYQASDAPNRPRADTQPPTPNISTNRVSE